VTARIRQSWLIGGLLTLTAVTGLIDAVSYLRLGHVFVANMTGNIVFIGFALAPGSGLSPLASGVALGGFMIGAALGGIMARRLADRQRRWLGTAMATQAVVLAAVTIVVATSSPNGLVVTVPLAVCFGLQSATVRRVGVADLPTTVLTMTLTNLAAAAVLGGAVWGEQRQRLAAVGCMLAGAAAGALLLRVNMPVVIGLATVLVAAVAVAFGRGPAADPA
jgi:uncharacterized membrane protein YoaK (UPF0700 family)